MILVLTFVAALCWAFSHWFSYLGADPSLTNLPTISGFTRASPIFAVIWFFGNIGANTRDGYTRSLKSSGLFKVPFYKRWAVFITSRDRIVEVATENNGRIASVEAIEKLLQLGAILSPLLIEDPYHVTVAVSHLRVTDALVTKMHLDVTTEYENLIPMDHGEVPAMDLAYELVIRINNMLLLGSTHYEGVNLSSYLRPFFRYFFLVGTLVSYLPTSLGRILVDYIFRPRNTLLRKIEEIVIQRKAVVDLDGGAISANFSPLMDRLIKMSYKRGASTRQIAAQLVQLQLASMHSTALMVTYTWYWLAANTEWQEELRNEVLSVTRDFGWSKGSLSRMRKVSSFIKEVLRLQTLGAVSVNRLVTSPFKFKDGTEIPAGTQIFAPVTCIHEDDNVWPSAKEFQPFRHCSEAESEPGREDPACTSPEYLSFGHGYHACPGRFLAGCELKLIVANLVTNYIIELKDRSGKRPEDSRIGGFYFPDRYAKLIIRRRA